MSDDSFSDIASGFFGMDRDSLAERYPNVAEAFAKYDAEMRTVFDRMEESFKADVLSFAYHERPWFIMLHVEQPETANYYLNGAITGMIEPSWSQVTANGFAKAEPSKLRIMWRNELMETLVITHISRWEQERCTHRASIGPLTAPPDTSIAITFDHEGGASWEAVPIPNFST